MLAVRIQAIDGTRTSTSLDSQPCRLLPSRQLTAHEVQSFRSKVESGGFWNAPSPINDQTGTDGSQWIIEGVKAGRYHVVDRWMPKNGPARDLGLFLSLDLARLSIPKNEIY